MRARIGTLFHSAFLRRVMWHVRRVAKQIDRRFFLALFAGLGGGRFSGRYRHHAG